jgi:hypothetical protein
MTPPPELVEQWRHEPEYSDGHHKITMVTMSQDRLMEICEKSALHGADCELNTCCDWLKEGWDEIRADKLRAARRPKPPSLKERALQAWAAVEAGTDDQTAMAVIRLALEALPND